MAETKKRSVNVKNAVKVKGGSTPGPFYGLGMLGAAVFFIQQASGFGEVVVALLKALIWPAYFVWEVFKYIWQ